MSNQEALASVPGGDSDPALAGARSAAGAQGGPTEAGEPEASRAKPGATPGLNLSDEAVAQYERVAAKLIFEGENEPFTVAVTSSVSGEGVSTVCFGLALALAASTAKRVALVDANLRRPALNEMLRVPAGPGLHEVIVGNENCVWRPDSTEVFGALSPEAVRTSVRNLWLVRSGVAMQHPAQLMTSEGAKTVIRGLRARFGYVVIDCPPVLTAVDAASICRLADGVLIVVRAGLTPRDDVTRARTLLGGLPIMGVVLNGV